MRSPGDAHRPRRLFYFLSFLLLFIPTTVRSDDSLEGKPVSQITIRGNRTAPDILKSRISLREGQPFRQADVDETKRRLHEMRLFKNVGIESRLDASGIGVDVFIDAEDGWFFLPFPLFTGGGGGGRFSLLLLERNYFRRAESLFGVGMFNKESERIIIGAGLPHFSVSGSIHQRDFLERQYADGGFNATSGWRTTRDEDDPERFGSINEAHDKEFEGGTFSVSLRPVSPLKTSLSFEANEVSYASSPAASPGDAGNQNAVQVGVSFGPGDSNRANFAETFGVLFGLGLAGVRDAAPLSRTRWIWGGDISAAHGAKAVGSDFTFSQLSAALSGSAEFPSRHRLNGRLSLSQGIDLPFSRKIATGRDLGLKGNYAREFRGDTGAGTSIGYTRLLRRSARGILAAEAFVERGTVWQKDGPRFHQDGVGASFYYRFWRFPLPLGISYTQSLTDDDGQVSFAIGGMF
ncbi:MAG: hypothetical protein KCHDKBKB_01639 [Elusimicrobia bacterium]|nr:hypothetical protein [Elusimicrobiota bacterium]